MAAWGWRIPMLIGCAIIPVILWLRGSLEETAAFEHIKHKPHSLAEVIKLIGGHLGQVLVGTMLVVFTTTTFYMITAYTPTFGKAELDLNPNDVLLITALVGLSNLIWLPLGGALSDRIGRYPMLFAVPLTALAVAYPMMAWMVADPSFSRLLTTVLVYSTLFGIYNGSLIVLLTEFMPARIRTAAFSLAYSLATAIFGGFTPLISTALINSTHNKAAPALWLSCAAAISLAGVVLSRRFSRLAPDASADPLGQKLG